jgi:hypothetical protein
MPYITISEAAKRDNGKNASNYCIRSFKGLYLHQWRWVLLLLLLWFELL